MNRRYNVMRFLASIIFCAVVMAFAVTPALASILTVTTNDGASPTRNSTIGGADGQLLDGASFTNYNRGAQAGMYIGNGGTGGTDGVRSLVRFSLAGLPANQTITSATLQLSEFDGGLFSAGSTASVYRILVSWLEGDGTNNQGTIGTTWLSRDKGGSLANWTVGGATGAGSDRAATPTATGGSGNISTFNAYNNILSLNVTSDVQLWYSGAAANNGWLIQATTYNSAQYAEIYTREEGGPYLPPTLVITYVPAPEPASLALLSLGGMVLLRRRK